jgi:hypothetical protein
MTPLETYLRELLDIRSWGAALTKEEICYVQEMARRIAALLLLEPALDANHQNVKAHTFTWKG